MQEIRARDKLRHIIKGVIALHRFANSLSRRDLFDVAIPILAERRDIRPTRNWRYESKNSEDLLNDISSLSIRDVEQSLLLRYFEVRTWFFSSPEYLNWLEGRPWQLHCYGECGCGKVSLAQPHSSLSIMTRNTIRRLSPQQWPSRSERHIDQSAKL